MRTKRYWLWTLTLTAITLLACLWTASLLPSPVAYGWPWDRPQPTAEISASPAKIKAGESSTLTWSSTNGTATLDGQQVEANGTKAVKPAATTTYTLTVQASRRRVARATVTVEVTVEPPPPPPPPPPPGDSGLSAVGIGSAFSLSDTLSRAAADHDLRVFIESQLGTWFLCDDLAMAAPHPAAMDGWVKVLKDGGKKAPAVVWYSAKGGKITILGIDECGPATTGAELLAKARSYVPKPTDTLVINGKVRSLGLRPAKRGAPINAPRVSEILKPLASDQYPVNVDLRTQFPRCQDQGPYGTCVSNSMSGCYEGAVFRSFGNRNATAFSPNFLATVGDGWNGAWGSQIAEILMTTGIVTLDQQPNYSRQLPPDWKAKAAKNKALGVYGPPNGNSRGYVAAAIARGLPVSVAIAVGNGFSPDNQGYITYARGGGGQVNHQVIAAGGYFQHDGKRFWIMKNSWGKDFGVWNDGCCFLEDRFLDDDTDMWVIVVPSANDAYRFDSPN